jgi:hypothetical protein
LCETEKIYLSQETLPANFELDYTFYTHTFITFVLSESCSESLIEFKVWIFHQNSRDSCKRRTDSEILKLDSCKGQSDTEILKWDSCKGRTDSEILKLDSCKGRTDTELLKWSKKSEQRTQR